MIEEKRKTIRTGFWLGIGLIIPIAIGMYFSSWISSTLYKYFSPSEEYESYMPVKNVEKNIIIESFRDVKLGNKVFINGSIINKGNKPLGSIQLEAEFFNEKGEFVYEESEYIKKTLAPNERENFQIKCGCTDVTFPEYKKVTVRVVSASNG